MDVTLPTGRYVPKNSSTEFLTAPSSIVIVTMIRPGFVLAAGIFETDDDQE